MVQPLELHASDSVLVFAPHPDDETLASGGLLQQARAVGTRLRVVFVTDGENNPWPQRALDRRWKIGPADRARWGERRRGEARAALRCLGLGEDASFLGLPDQGLTSLALTSAEALLGAIRREIATHQPTLVVGPSPRDHHPDHSALGVALELAHRTARQDERSPPRMRLLHVLVHGRPSAPREKERIVLYLTPEQRQRKRNATLAYRSQLVFRGRFFLSFVRETEEFGIPRPSALADSLHPIREAVLDGDCLRLRIRSRSLFWAAQPSELLLVLSRAMGSTVGLRIALASGSRSLEVRSAATGAVVGRASSLGKRRDGVILLPRSLLGTAKSVFAKVEHPWTFFDEDGWREVVGAAASAPADAPAMRDDPATLGVGVGPS